MVIRAVAIWLMLVGVAVAGTINSQPSLPGALLSTDAMPAGRVGAATAYKVTVGQLAGALSVGTDPRLHGATINNSTDDDAVAINAAINAATGNAAGKTVVISGFGYYDIASPIVVQSNVHLVIMGGAAIRAKSTFTGSMITFSATSEFWSVSGRGLIEGGNYASYGIDVGYGRFAKIGDGLEIHGCNINGIRLGDPGVTYSSYEIDVENVRIYYNDVANHPDSIGLYHRRSTDGYVRNVQVIGYRKGFQSDSGAVDYSQCHTWSRPINGPYTHSFYANSNNISYSQCYADSPNAQDGSTVYAFYLNGFNCNITSSRVYNGSTYGADNVVVAIHIAKDYSSTVVKGFTAIASDDGARLKKVIESPYSLSHSVMISGLVTDTRVVDNADTANLFGLFHSITHQPFTFNALSTFNAVSAFNSAMNVKGAAGGQLNIDTAASGQKGDIIFKTNGVSRWNWRKDDVVEDGSDNGSNMILNRYSDAGAFMDSPISVSRQFGSVTFPNAVTGLSTHTVRTATGGQVVLDTVGATQDSDLVFQEAGSNRWRIRKGATGGAAFIIERFDDSGIFIDQPLTIDRATGKVALGSINVGAASTPASATATCTAGDRTWDASYIYQCVATNTWKRTAISTWP